jgi:hypothetical protein
MPDQTPPLVSAELLAQRWGTPVNLDLLKVEDDEPLELLGRMTFESCAIAAWSRVGMARCRDIRPGGATATKRVLTMRQACEREENCQRKPVSRVLSPHRAFSTSAGSSSESEPTLSTGSVTSGSLISARL